MIAKKRLCWIRNRCKSMHFNASPPSENLARLRAQMQSRPRCGGATSELESWEVSFCEDILTYARTHFEHQP